MRARATERGRARARATERGRARARARATERGRARVMERARVMVHNRYTIRTYGSHSSHGYYGGAEERRPR